MTYTKLLHESRSKVGKGGEKTRLHGPGGWEERRHALVSGHFNIVKLRAGVFVRNNHAANHLAGQVQFNSAL